MFSEILTTMKHFMSQYWHNFLMINTFMQSSENKLCIAGKRNTCTENCVRTKKIERHNITFIDSI